MVILSIGIEPRQDSNVTQRLLTLSKTSDGFFVEAHPKLKPVDAPTGGVFLAGCTESPKDIKDSVTQASAAAARAEILMARGSVTAEAITPVVNMENCTLCGLCARVCPLQRHHCRQGTEKTGVVEAACAGCGACSARGAVAVLVAGCHLGDCHHINANYQTKRKVEKLWKKM